jgi:xylan 1,4-beta-xylosidase
MRHIRLAAALGLVILTAGRTASAESYTITVNAGMQTSGNPRFWTASVGTGTASLTLRADLQTHYKIGNRELGMQRVRGHGVLNDDMNIYRGPGSYNWTNFDKYLDAIVLAGMRPIMELSFMPAALARNGSSHDPPNNMTNYRNFIQAVVQHCVDRYGAADVGQWYWEVWNEPDYAGFWNGTMDDYYALYDAAVDGATAVLPNIFIGGPASTWHGPIGPFLQHCRTANKRVTFVSSHKYPGADGSTPANAADLLDDNTSRLGEITGAGYTTTAVKSFNTEWNSAYSGQGGNPGDANLSMDNHWNVGFILKGVKLIADRNQGDTAALEVFSYWVLSDVFDESSGPSGSYILGQGGNLPFGRVFGLMTFQGVRKAPFNAFKMLNYLGPKRITSSGGRTSDGVDAMATMSAANDEVQILVYNYYATLNTTGTDNVTVNLNNLPAALAGKELFVTHFRADETHSNPFNVWAAAGRPTNPTEAQWQAMKQQQHLALLSPVSKMTVTTSFTTSFELPRQAGSLIILGLKRPLTGRNALVEIEGEDYDGQSGVAKEDSADSTTLGQSINGRQGNYAFYRNVDFTDAGVSAVQLRVNAQAATTLELRADTPTGVLLGTCQVAATGGSWATQTCTLAPTMGVKILYVVFGGTARLNWMKFQGMTNPTGAGGAGGGGGPGGAGGGAGGRGGGGAGGGMVAGAGGSNAGSGGSGSGGSATGVAGSGVSGSGGSGSGGSVTGAAGSGASGSGGSGSGGSGGGNGGGGTGVAGTSGTAGTGTGRPPGGAGGGGCGCRVGDAGGSSGMLLIVGLAAVVLRPRRSREGRSNSSALQNTPNGLTPNGLAKQPNAPDHRGRHPVMKR